MKSFTIIFADPFLVAIDKPPSMLVHRTTISTDRVFILQQLREQLGRHVFPVHRLDRATSGLLLFALNSETAALIAKEFTEGRIQKKYMAVVRGFTDAEGAIDHPIRDSGEAKVQEALTEYRTIDRTEVPIAVRPHPSARYSLIEVLPQTGRRHQIRRHLKHISHPIIGDVRYGDGRHNRLFREQFGINRLLLHATAQAFKHPISGKLLQLEAPLPEEFCSLARLFRWKI
ncbi:MAG: pseudouridylate synthase [Acidobacteriota bacterium]|nr:MAG: pseudouridylate synthase [Acidobacteriota bacterium]